MNICKYLTVKRTAEILGGGPQLEGGLEQLAKSGAIRSVLLPGTDIPLIDLDSLWQYLKQCRSESTAREGAAAAAPANRQQLISRVLALVDEIGHKSVKRQRWINLVGRSTTNRVFAQLHLPKASRSREFDGVFLVLPNRDDFDLSGYEAFAADASLTDLEGDYGPNADWLRGNGVRGTTSPAKIFHLPLTLLSPDNQDQWSTLKDLLIIAQRKRG